MTTDVRQIIVEVNPNDLGNATTTLATLFSIPVKAAVNYGLRVVLAYNSAAVTTGARFVLDGPALTYLAAQIEQTLTATTKTTNYVSGYNLPAAANASSVLSGNVATIDAVVKVSADGNLLVRFASEVATSAITIKGGSHYVLTPLS